MTDTHSHATDRRHERKHMPHERQQYSAVQWLDASPTCDTRQQKQHPSHRIDIERKKVDTKPATDTRTSAVRGCFRQRQRRYGQRRNGRCGNEGTGCHCSKNHTLTHVSAFTSFSPSVPQNYLSNAVAGAENAPKTRRQNRASQLASGCNKTYPTGFHLGIFCFKYKHGVLVRWLCGA